MKRHTLTSLALLPLLLSYSHAAQSWATDPPAQPWIFSSEDSGSTSYLGVDIGDVTTERLGTLKLKEEKGAEITMVDQDAPAGKAGLKEHDVILSLNGAPVESAAQLRRMIHEIPPGRIISLGLSRDGQPLTVKIQLGDRHTMVGFGPNMKDLHIEVPDMHVMPDIDIPSMNMVVVTSSPRSGLTVENITPQLGEFFGVKNGNGVLVRSVEKGSRAEKAGFHAGDIIVKVNDQAVHDTSDFTHAVRSRNGNSVSVGVIREKREQNLNLTLPERKESSDLLQNDSADEEPLFNADSMLNFSEWKDEIAKLKPEMELAWQEQAESLRKAVDEAHKSLCTQQKKFAEETTKNTERLKRQAQEQREQLRKQREKLREQMKEMRQELQGHWLDI
ncbi:MAG TPA: PDZ domain-containing protein [Candidatus Sulfotelmatobacter sp.]|nr:PDZ domain-containing protein [Candidatus Sulfotelmatobacter sp.]